jgi:hypothetical protein
VQSPCNALIEYYTQIFYMIDEGDIPSIQYKMRLRGPESMRKVDGLRLMFRPCCSTGRHLPHVDDAEA